MAVVDELVLRCMLLPSHCRLFARQIDLTHCLFRGIKCALGVAVDYVGQTDAIQKLKNDVEGVIQKCDFLCDLPL